MTILKKKKSSVRLSLAWHTKSVEAIKQFNPMYEEDRFKKDAITIRIEEAQKTKAQERVARKRQRNVRELRKDNQFMHHAREQEKAAEAEERTPSTKSYPFLRSKKVTLIRRSRWSCSLKTSEEPKVVKMGIDVILVGKIQRILFVFVRYLLHVQRLKLHDSFLNSNIMRPCHLSLPCISTFFSEISLNFSITSLSSAHRSVATLSCWSISNVPNAFSLASAGISIPMSQFSSDTQSRLISNPRPHHPLLHHLRKK